MIIHSWAKPQYSIIFLAGPSHGAAVQAELSPPSQFCPGSRVTQKLAVAYANEYVQALHTEDHAVEGEDVCELLMLTKFFGKHAIWAFESVWPLMKTLMCLQWLFL